MQESVSFLRPALLSAALSLAFIAPIAHAADADTTGCTFGACSSGTANSLNTSAVSATFIGNATGGTSINGSSVTSTAGNTTLNQASDTATSTVTGAGTRVSETSLVNAGQSGMVVDANGRIASGTTSQSTASVTVTNSVGNVHGLVVTESQTTLSGGTQSSSMTLNDNGATFSNASSGAPIQVHGVADGTASFDAVNVRQFAGAIAAVAATANIPQVAEGKQFTLGGGVGSFMGRSAAPCACRPPAS